MWWEITCKNKPLDFFFFKLVSAKFYGCQNCFTCTPTQPNPIACDQTFLKYTIRGIGITLCVILIASRSVFPRARVHPLSSAPVPAYVSTINVSRSSWLSKKSSETHSQSYHFWWIRSRPPETNMQDELSKIVFGLKPIFLLFFWWKPVYLSIGWV